jgi:hypothetical protein
MISFWCKHVDGSLPLKSPANKATRCEKSVFKGGKSGDGSGGEGSGGRSLVCNRD